MNNFVTWRLRGYELFKLIEFFLNSLRSSAAVFAVSLSFRSAAAMASIFMFEIAVYLEPFGVENRDTSRTRHLC